MAAGEASQTTPMQIMHVFVLCCSTQIMQGILIMWGVLIPVRGLHGGNTVYLLIIN